MSWSLAMLPLQSKCKYQAQNYRNKPTCNHFIQPAEGRGSCAEIGGDVMKVEKLPSAMTTS